MIAVTNEIMKELDNKMIVEYKIPSLILMEEAALRIVEVILKKIEYKKFKIVILAGSGNNGGDAIAVGRLFHCLGFDVLFFCFNETNKTTKEYKIQEKIIKKIGLHIYNYDDFKNKKFYDNEIVFVDGLFGTGFKGTLSIKTKEIIKLVNNYNGLKVSIDIPSGINGNDDKTKKIFFKSNLTITFCYPKIAHIFNDNLGEVFIANISFVPGIKLNDNKILYFLKKKDLKNFFKKRKLETNKGSYGHIGILGGAKNMPGAIFLSGKGALKTGAGLITLWMEKFELLEIMRKYSELMISSWNDFLNKNIDVLILGPGLGFDFNIDLEKKLFAYKGPIILDADGITCLQKNIIKRNWIKGELILTPHPKEMSTLLDYNVEEINKNRIKTAKECSKEWNAITVLKGNKTIITDGNIVNVNLTGNPGMATAGSGDVLSGIIASFIAQGCSSYDGAKFGVYLHGLSGDLGAKSINEYSLSSLDIVAFLPKAIKSILKYEENKNFIEILKD